MQVLTFLRNTSCDSFALNISQLKKHVESIGHILPASFKDAMENLFNGEVRFSVLQLFLKPSADCTYVQTGIAGRKSPKNVYIRSCVLKKSALEDSVVKKLEGGEQLFVK